MSTENRLKRLGLWHLRDNPEELQKELDRRIAERRKEEEAWAKDRERLIAKRLEDQKNAGEGQDPPAPASPSE